MTRNYNSRASGYREDGEAPDRRAGRLMARLAAMVLGESPQGEPTDYYYVNLHDWPTRHYPHGLSVQEIYDVLGRFDDVHGLAKSTQEQVDEANREIERRRLDNADPNNSSV